jgi:hypothetical protein
MQIISPWGRVTRKNAGKDIRFVGAATSGWWDLSKDLLCKIEPI